MADRQAAAFITARKGTCYLTIKRHRRNIDLMRIYQYKIDPEDKRHMRRRHPEVIFDWPKITKQLAEKREDCRLYRSRRRSPNAGRRPRIEQPLYGVFDPSTRAVYMSGLPTTARGAGTLLDAILSIDRRLMNSPTSVPPSKDSSRCSRTKELGSGEQDE